MLLGLFDGGRASGIHPSSNWRKNFLVTYAFVAKGILCQSFAEAFEHAIVIDNQTEVLARINPVGPSDGLHECVGFHRLVYIQG